MIYQISQSSWIKKAAPIALAITAGVGVIGTAALAASATPKALEKKSEAEKEKGESLTTWEKFKAMAPSYFPAAGTGIITIGAISGAIINSNKKQAELATIIAGGNQIINKISRKYSMLHDTVKEKHPEIIKEFEEKSFDDKWNEYVQNKLDHKKAWSESRCFPDCIGEDWGIPRLFGIEYGNGLADENGHEIIFFEATPGDIMNAVYNLNGLYHDTNYPRLVRVNDFFHLLNLPKTQLGDLLVWDPEVLYDEWQADWIGIYTEDWQMEDNVPQPAVGTIIRFHIPPLAEGYAEGIGIQSRLFPTESSKMQSV